MPRLLPILVTVVVLALVGAGYWAVFLKPSGAQTASSGPPQIVVEAAPAIKATSVRKLKAVGTLASNQAVMIRPEIAGRLTEIGFEDGARVKAGTTLAVLDRSVLRAELASAEATLVLAREDYARADELLKRGTGTKQRKDQALATLRSAEAEVALARAQMAKFTVTAPFDGRLGIRRVDIGAYLAAGEDIVNLEQTDPIKVNFEVPERFMTELEIGKEVQLRSDAYRDEVIPAWIEAIDPQINPRTRAVRVQALTDNKDGQLRPGQFVSVTVRVFERRDATFVPEQALVPNRETATVYLIEAGQARPVPVRSGIRVARHVEILEGLAPGDLVVTAGQQRLGPGAPVIAREPTFVPPSPPDEEIQGDAAD